MNITRNEARSGVALSRALKLSALGVLTVSALACGDATPANSTPHIGSSGGTTGAAGTSSSSGGTSAAGTTSTSGSVGIAGTDATGGGATGTAGTASVAGTGGTTVATQPFCSPLATPVQPRVPLPFAVTNAFYPSGYEGGDPGQNGGGQIAAGACTDRSPTMIGGCSKYTYTPATPATWAGVAYNRGYNGFGSTGHAPVCLADGATAITFYAKGAVGGEVVGFSGGTAMAQTITLTNAWVLYTISVSGLQYNTDATGLEDGFFWKVAPVGSVGVLTSFYVDSIQYVGSPGTGGTGGAGGTGGTGGAAAGTGGTGGAAAGSGGTGGA